MNAATATFLKPWFQREMERVTGERWKVLFLPNSVRIECPHGMLITVPHPPGLVRPFLNDEAERAFVGKALRQHAKDYRISYKEGQGR